MFALSIVASLLLGQKSIRSWDVAEFRQLGRQREAFGDLERAVDSEGEEYWSYIISAEGHTQILFPVGVSDRRYYYQPQPGYLVYETNTEGRIRLEWAMELEDLPQGLKHERSVSGTLGKMLALFGLRPKGKLTPAMRASLRAVKGFAWYRFDVMSQTFSAGYLFSDAEWLQEPALPWPDDSPHPPRYSEPYPVTTFERSELKRMNAGS